ncbi:putative Nuclear hormone receptor,putative [Aphelenchoides besseyi]|nr:putative Nuclear hormone receptor,putative [Aphelenchoides besseyi]
MSLIPSASNSKICRVCEQPAEHSHFGGVVSCNACCAFFRRTVAERKSYRCRRDLNCVMKKELYKRGCQFCRFQQCLKIGMKVDLVLSQPKIDEFNDETLGFLLRCRRATFVVRHDQTVRLYNGPEHYCNMSNKRKTAKSCTLALKAERRVLEEFVRMTGIADENDLNFANELVDNFLQLWVSCESVISTARNRGFDTNRAHYVDDSYLEFTEAHIADYYRQYGIFKDCVMLARLCWNLFNEIVEVGRALYALRLKDEEFTVIQFIFLLQMAIRLHPQPQRYRSRLNSLFRALQKHYQENYDDMAIKMGNLILSMQHLEELKRVQDEAFTIQALNEIKLNA